MRQSVLDALALVLPMLDLQHGLFELTLLARAHLLQLHLHHEALIRLALYRPQLLIVERLLRDDALVDELELCAQLDLSRRRRLRLRGRRQALCEVETHEVVSVQRASTFRTLADTGRVQPASDARLMEDVAALARRYRITRLEASHTNGALNLHFSLF